MKNDKCKNMLDTNAEYRVTTVRLSYLQSSYSILLSFLAPLAAAASSPPPGHHFVCRCPFCVRTFNCNWILITALSAKNVAASRLSADSQCERRQWGGRNRSSSSSNIRIRSMQHEIKKKKKNSWMEDEDAASCSWCSSQFPYSRLFDLFYSFVVERQQLNERQPTAVDVLKVAFAVAVARCPLPFINQQQYKCDDPIAFIDCWWLYLLPPNEPWAQIN